MPSHPPIDPEIAAGLTAPGISAPSLYPREIAARRAAVVFDREILTRGGAITVTDLVAEGPADNERIAVLVLRSATASNDGPAPGMLYIHGGGMMMGNRSSIDPTILDAVLLGYTVISPEYRLAPEHPYPAAIEDCFATWCWMHDHAAELGIDPDYVLIAGSSAGGGLAAGSTLLIRDRQAPLPARQILFCPMLDDREVTASSTELDGEALWDRNANRTGWSAYLGERVGGDDVPIYAAPARATDLSGLPPAFLDVGDVETFRDEDIDYAARLSRAGVPVELHVWPGGVHGFTNVAPQAALSRMAMAARVDYMRRALTSRTAATRVAEPVAD
jgi:acetyl esterase/lipase